MKNIYLKISIILLSLVITTSCSNDFVNSPEPSGELAPNVIFSSNEGATAHLSGIMRRLRGQFTRTDAAGINSMYFARAVKGNDLIQNSWFNFDYENDNREPTYTRTRFSWDFPYFVINQTNILIAGVEAATAISDADKKALLGQAKTVRAFFYFQLAMEFQHTYSYDAALPAPPLYKVRATEAKGMSTIQEMYDFILEDLLYATANLNTSRLGKSYINVNVANGVLARVYQTTHNWTGAEAAANIAYGGGTPSSFLNTDYTVNNGFNDITNKEWIWGHQQTEDQTNYYWLAPHVFTDHVNGPYNGTYINNDFVNLFSATDARKNDFVNKFNVDPTDPANWYTWISNKFTFGFTSDYPLMRSAEMVLIEAEAKYYNSDPTGAHTLLFGLQSVRDPLAVKSGNTGTALLEEILVERRKELYAEIGVEWFDAKRYRRAIPRTGNSRLMSAGLAVDDVKFFLKIPQKEIDANDNIDDTVNANR